MASADAHTTTVIAQPTEPHAASVAGQITGPSNVGAPGGGTVQPVTHHPQEGHRIDKDAPVVTSHEKDEEEEEMPSRGLLPDGQPVAVAEVRKALQDKRTDSYWSFRITTPSQS